MERPNYLQRGKSLYLLDKDVNNILKSEGLSKDTLFSFLNEANFKEKIISIPNLLKYNTSILKKLKEIKEEKVSSFFRKLNPSFSDEEKTIKDKKEDVKPFVKVISSVEIDQRKIVQQDFVTHFRNRYERLRKILETQQLENLTTIRKIKGSKGMFTIIGMVYGKRTTKNKNIILEIEDLTGQVSILINKNKKEVYTAAKDIVSDEVIAFNVSNNNNFIYCNSFSRPLASLPEKKRCKKDIWVAFISDLHCGSVFFLEKQFLNFIKWLNGAGNSTSSKEIAPKVNYLFISGDIIDGVSHYPGQDKYLNIFTSKGQYNKITECLKLIRKDLQIIACPGNHDSVWVGEPQGPVSKRWAEPLYSLENFLFVSNPSLVEIEGGFRILMYHGASMYHFMNEIPELRLNYGLDYPEVYVAEMLKRRHLAPIHGSVDYIPCGEDPLVIDKIPDIILTGDIHRSSVAIHNNILSVGGSCWQSNTPFFDKVGIHPDPCKVTLFNLKTREIKILDFSEDKEESEKNIVEEKYEKN